MLALGGLVVAALFAALLVPFFVDWSSFRVAFEDQASRLLGKKVAVHGSVDARILPFPSVTLHDVRVGQDVDGQPLVQVAQFSMDMELAPFLSGEARIFDMRIDKPKVRFRILKDGTFEWLRGSRPTIAARSVILEDVHIMGGEIEIIDDRNGQVRHMTGLSTDLSAGTLAGPWRGEGNAVLDGQEARFSLTSGEAAAEGRHIPLRLRVWPDAHPVVVDFDGELAAVDNKPSYNGKFNLAFLQEEDESEPVKAPPPGPRVSGDFELTGERARIPQYRVEVGPKENPYIVTGEATLDTGPKPEFLLTADGQQIDVNRLSDGPQAKTGRNPAASAQRRLNAFVQMVASIPIPQVPGRVNLKLPAIVFNDTTIRDIHLDVRPAGRGWAVDNVTATLPRRTRLDGLRVVLDCANGAAYRTAPAVLWELGAEVIPMGVEPNGFNINEDCGSTHPEQAARRVRETRADLGVCLDGDADRVILIDETGRVADGDQIMGLIAARWKEAGMLAGDSLVATVMSNLGLERYL